MPPAFVLSQDQTLRKKNFLSEIPIQAFDFLRLLSIRIFQGLHRTIQFSISPPHQRGNGFLIYHRPRSFQIAFRRFFELFLSAPQPPANLKQSVTGRKTSFNIALADSFASRFSAFFATFFQGKIRENTARANRAEMIFSGWSGVSA